MSKGGYFFVLVCLFVVFELYSAQPIKYNVAENNENDLFHTEFFPLYYESNTGINSYVCEKCFSEGIKKFNYSCCVNSTYRAFDTLNFRDTFNDTVEDLVLQNITFLAYGAFNCGLPPNTGGGKETFQETITLYLNEIVANESVPVPSSETCYCPNCPRTVSFSLSKVDNKIVYYFNGTNTVKITVDFPVDKEMRMKQQQQQNKKKLLKESEPGLIVVPFGNPSSDDKKIVGEGSFNPYACLSGIDMDVTVTVRQKNITFVNPTVMPSNYPAVINARVATIRKDIPQCVYIKDEDIRREYATISASTPSEVSYLCPIPVNASGWYDFSLEYKTPWGTNQSTSNNTKLFFYKKPEITKVFPNHAPLKGGTNISVYVDFGDLNGTVGVCGFNGSKGTYIQNVVSQYDKKKKVLTCRTPTWTSPEKVNLTVSLNMINFTDPYVFEFRDSDDSKYVLIICICVLSLVIAIAIIAIVLWIKNKQSLDGYERIREGNVVVDLKDIVLGERIGKGTFGEVYKGVWRGATVAVKMLTTQQITEEFVREFEKEVGLMRSLRSPNVLQFLGSAFQPPKNVCIVIEYMSRGSLHGILHNYQTVLDWELLLKMIADTARGMVYLHTCNPPVIHRDLKSHNLLVDEFWRVKVCDFGLSTVLEHQSQTMTACGTPCWTAPEVLKHLHYTVKADVYSFAIVLWECAARVDPYQGMPPFKVIYAVGREKLRPRVPPGLPPEYVKLMRDCWDDDPEKRPTFDFILDAVGDMFGLGWTGQPQPHEALTAAAAAAASASQSINVSGSPSFGSFGKRLMGPRRTKTPQGHAGTTTSQQGTSSDADGMMPLVHPSEKTPLLSLNDDV